jgi:tRNA pseudouridine55 synthase
VKAILNNLQMAKNKLPTFPPLIINAYKPKGVGSSDVVRYFKHNLPTGFGKIGHLGTLDPFAEGVLLIAIAGASRLSDIIHDRFYKEYEAEGVLGISYDTGDVTGEILAEDSEINKLTQKISLDDLNNCAKTFEGYYDQTPPYYSATKHEGVSLHKLARQGTYIKKEPVRRYVKSFRVISIEGKKVKFRCEVSSGTYIRVLFEDFSKKLNTIGVLKNLKRTKIGPFNIENSFEKSLWPTRGDSFDIVLSKPWYLERGGPCFCPSRVFESQRINLCLDDWKKFKNGHDLKPSVVGTKLETIVSLFSPSGRLSALANVESGIMKPFVRFSPFLD